MENCKKIKSKRHLLFIFIHPDKRFLPKKNHTAVDVGQQVHIHAFRKAEVIHGDRSRPKPSRCRASTFQMLKWVPQKKSRKNNGYTFDCAFLATKQSSLADEHHPFEEHQHKHHKNITHWVLRFVECAHSLSSKKNPKRANHCQISPKNVGLGQVQPKKQHGRHLQGGGLNWAKRGLCISEIKWSKKKGCRSAQTDRGGTSGGGRSGMGPTTLRGGVICFGVVFYHTNKSEEGKLKCFQLGFFGMFSFFYGGRDITPIPTEEGENRFETVKYCTENNSKSTMVRKLENPGKASCACVLSPEIFHPSSEWSVSNVCQKGWLETHRPLHL